MYGAPGRNRIGTTVRSRDFKLLEFFFEELRLGLNKHYKTVPWEAFLKIVVCGCLKKSTRI